METAVTPANRAEIERLVNSLVVPRPIAWITTVSSDGELNLAPFSYFQVVSTDPVILMISFTGEKDSLLN
ncbi:MAG: flavin reductase, partial [Mycetocola sp.]